MDYKIEIKTYKLKEAIGEKVNSPEIAFSALKDDFNAIQEELYLLLLGPENKIIEKILVAKGSLSSTTIDPASIFRNVLLSRGNSFILAHNHPSGDVTPSEEDLLFVKNVMKGARTVGLTFVDNLIYSDKKFLSFKKEHLL